VSGAQQNPTVNSMRVFVIALDSANNVVLNPSTYDQPIQVELIYTDCCGDPDVSDPPNLTLTAAYNASVDPGGCGGNPSTSTGFTSVNVCSPSDVVTATFKTAVTNGPQAAEFIGSVSGTGNLSAPATAAPTALPTGLPAGVGSLFVEIFTPPQTGLLLTQGSNGSPFTVTNITSNGVGNTDLSGNTLYIFESGFVGSYTVGGTCGAFAALTLTNNDGFGDGSIAINPTAATPSCTITVSDGTNTDSVTMSVTTTAVFGS